MVNIADKIFDFLRKRFSLSNRRFPTPAESEVLLEQAQNIVNKAVQNNIERFGPDVDMRQVMAETFNQPPQKIIEDASNVPQAPGIETIKQPKAQIEAMPLKDPERRQMSVQKKLEALNEQARGSLKTADEVTTGPAARSKVQRDKAGLESLGDQIPVRDDTARPRMPMRLIEDFGTEFSEEQLIKQGYTPTQAEILMAARKKMLSGEEINPNEALMRVKEERADELGIDVEDLDPEGSDFEIDFSERDDFAGGGAAKKLMEKLSRQSKSPFGRMAMKESGQALPKGVESGSLMGDILEGVNKIEDLLGNTKSLPQSRFEIADFVMNMRKDGFSNDAIIDIVANYGPQYSLKTLRKQIAPQVKIANNLGAKTSAQRNFIVEMEDTKDIYSPDEFREKIREGDFKYVLSDAVEKDLIAKGLSEEQASDLALMIPSDNVYEGLKRVKDRAYYDHDIDIEDVVEFYDKAYQDYVLPQTQRYRESYAGGGLVSKLVAKFNKAKKKNPKLSNEDFAQVLIDAEKAEKMGVKTIEEFMNMQKFKKEAFSKRKTYDELPSDKPKRKTLRLKKAEGGLAYLVGF